MGTRCALVVTIFIALVVVNSSVADTEGDSKTGENGKKTDVTNTNHSGNDKKEVIPEEKKGKDQVGNGAKKGAEDNINSDSSGKEGKVGVTEAGNEQKKTNDMGAETKISLNGDSKELGSKGADNEQKKKDDMVAEKKSDSDGNGKELVSKGAGDEQKKTDDTDSSLKKTNGKDSDLKKTNGKDSDLKKTKGKDSEQKKTNGKGTEKDGKNNEKAKGDSDLNSKDGTLAQARKEGGEECDSSSNSCTIKEKSIVACLRVPGNESPELSLLIQNKGKGPVIVTIAAPDFVKLEKKQIQVQENKNEKVMVSIGNAESESNIVLKAGNGKCSLDFKEMTRQGSRKSTVSTQLAYIDLLKSTPFVWFILLVVVLVIASVWVGISFRRKYVARNSPKYEKLEMELPISSGVSNVVPDSNDGWDDSWDDNWDDEEVAMAKSMPVTPSFSSKGIASRRVNKDAWKD